MEVIRTIPANTERRAGEKKCVEQMIAEMCIRDRWYAYETRINDIFGDYEVSNKELS